MNRRFIIWTLGVCLLLLLIIIFLSNSSEIGTVFSKNNGNINIIGCVSDTNCPSEYPYCVDSAQLEGLYEKICSEERPANRVIIQEEYNYDTSCQKDSDCIIENRGLDYSVCWPGSCKDVDYSLEEYIGVNAEKFYEFIEIKRAEMNQKCGGPPDCPSRAINLNYTAKCINSNCVKVKND